MISWLDTSNLDKKVFFSTLWIFVTFNYLYCDLIGLMDSNLLNQYITGKVEGMIISENFLLIAGGLMELPIAMILFSRILKYKVNKISNITVGLIKTIVMILTLFIGDFTPYYLFFAVIEIFTTTFIVFYAWNWKGA